MFGRILMLLLLSLAFSAWGQEATETPAATATAPDSAPDAKDAGNATSAEGVAAANEDHTAQAKTAGPREPVIDESATDSATCAAKWARYYKSQECFAPYHNVNHTMKPGAFEHCKVYKSPDECPPEAPQ